MPFTAVGLFPTAFMHPVAALPALLDCSLAVPAFYAGGMPPLLFGRFFRRKGAAGNGYLHTFSLIASVPFEQPEYHHIRPSG